MTGNSKYKSIIIDQWYRKNQFLFFKNYSEPCFNVTVDVDVTDLLKYCHNNDYSFFLTSLFIGLKAMNSVDEMRIRYVDEEVRLYSNIDAGCTILKEDNTFAFAYFNNEDDLSTFLSRGRSAIQEVKLGQELIARDDDMDLIHCSSLPWFSFSSFKHARDHRKNQSIPKLVFGKYRDVNGRMMMPLSIEVMHALVDGFHIGLFYKRLDELIVNLI